MKVGVAIPAYNGVKFIENGLRSCWKQTYPVSTYIADDCSDDGMTEFLTHKGRLTWYTRYIRNEHRLGWPMNNNRAVDMAFADGCDLVQFMSADDFLRLDCIEKQVQNIRGVDFSVPYLQQVGEENVVQISMPDQLPLDLAPWPNMVDKIMITRAAWEKVGGYANDITIPEKPWGCAEDWDFVIRLLKAGLTYSILKDPVYYYVMHPRQLWRGRDQVHHKTVAALRSKHPDVWEAWEKREEQRKLEAQAEEESR